MPPYLLSLQVAAVLPPPEIMGSLKVHIVIKERELTCRDGGQTDVLISFLHGLVWIALH